MVTLVMLFWGGVTLGLVIAALVSLTRYVDNVERKALRNGYEKAVDDFAELDYNGEINYESIRKKRVIR